MKNFYESIFKLCKKMEKVTDLLKLFLILTAIIAVLNVIAGIPKDAPFRSNMFCMVHRETSDGIKFYELNSLIWDLPIKAKPGYTVKMLPYGDHGKEFAEIFENSRGKLVARAYIR